MKLLAGLVLTAAIASPVHADAVDAEKFLGWFETLANNVVADQDSCPKMATDINKSVDDNKDLVAAAQKAHAAGQQFTQAQMQRMMAAGTKIAQAVVAKCAQDKGVKAAITRLPGPHAK